MNKKKICILSNGLARGGTDTFVVNLVKELDKEKYDITVILSTTDNAITVREPEVLDAGAKTLRTCGVDNFRGKIKHFNKLYQILKKEKFDVFHTNIDLFNGPNLLIAWLAGVKIRVCHSHNARQERELANGQTLEIKAYQWVMRELCWRFSNRRCGCSSLAMDFLFKNRWKNDYHSSVVNNGIEINKFRGKFDVNDKKNKLQLSAKYNLLTVGRLSAQKNPLFIVDVISELCKIRTDCDLLWIGTGNLESKVNDRITNKGIKPHVHMLGSRNDVNEIMQCCDGFLLPSVFEGLGIVLIEAQAAGLHCITSDVVPKEVDCGGCQFVSLDYPARKWAEIICDVLDGNIQLKLDEQKLQTFSLKHMAEQVEAIYK